MAKKYKVLKSFAYSDADGKKIYVRKWRMEGSLFIVDEHANKQQTICELSGEALKVGKKCKAIEPVED